MLRLVLLGPPGAGKGTQAALLKKQYGLEHISTGDLFRKAIEKGTDLGKQAQTFCERGELVPDLLVIAMVQNVVENLPFGQGFVLDGFPRTIYQAEKLENFLREKGQPLSLVIDLEASTQTLIQRMTGRLLCPKCGALYHQDKLNPDALICQNDEAALVQRKDDAKEKVVTRLQAFFDQTRPLREFYHKKQILISLDAQQPEAAVFERIRDVLDSHIPKQPEHN